MKISYTQRATNALKRVHKRNSKLLAPADEQQYFGVIRSSSSIMVFMHICTHVHICLKKL